MLCRLGLIGIGANEGQYRVNITLISNDTVLDKDKVQKATQELGQNEPKIGNGMNGWMLDAARGWNRVCVPGCCGQDVKTMLRMQQATS